MSESAQVTNGIRQLERDVIAMGDLVESQLEAALAALTRRDAVLADEVVRGDDAVDAWDVRIEEEGLEVLSRGRLEPESLRLAVVAVRSVTQLERVGDLAVGLAQHALALAADPALPQLEVVGVMGARVVEMMRASLDALARRDAGLARSVAGRDALVDEIHAGLFSTLEQLMRADSSTVERAVRLLSCSRSLERIGDHAKNVAEDVVYLAEGTIVRHRGVRERAAGEAILLAAR